MRTDLPKEDLIRWMTWIMEGFSQQIIADIGNKSLEEADIDDRWDAFDRLVEQMRILFYK